MQSPGRFDDVTDALVCFAFSVCSEDACLMAALSLHGLLPMQSYFHDIVNGTALPPHQVGVWIPKAKMGPEADCFRPLGMPNTLDRLVDGSVAAHAMHQTAHTMHPSQAVMSCFKEPQKAVSCIQRILDGDDSACTLLADLSKAFERVNPYWILELLRIKRAPRWCLLTPSLLFFSIAECLTKSRAGSSRAGLSYKELIWVDPSQCTFFVLPWIRFSLI